MKSWGILAFGLVLVFECSLLGCAPVLSVKSDPLQADVFYEDLKTGEKKPLGKTPFEISNSSLKQTLGEQFKAGEYFTLIVEKSGYLSEKLLVPATRFGTLLTSLNVKLKQGNDAVEQKLAKEILSHLFLAQKLASSHQFERAQIELDQVLAMAPDFPRALSMRASIYYLQKNYAESLKWYDSALKADPQLDDAIQMRAKILEIENKKP